MVERQLEKYKLLEEVGQGGMAVVYRGFDTALNREVAVKVLHPHLAEQEESKQRFQREAHAVAKLRHDNILEIYDYSGLNSEESYIVTEFIHGQTLKEFLARNPISHPEIAAMIIVEVCRALGHAHSLNIIHRDIKPENIMIREDGRVKLTDFGIAQIVDVQRLTVTGQLLGSPAYMAPELVEGRPIDFRADIFSVGTLLYQLAASELPFKGKNPHEVLKRIADCRFVPAEVLNPLIGDKLGKIIRKALSRDPEDRYAKIADLESELMGFLADVEIEDPSHELAAYFADSSGYSEQLQQRVVRTLTHNGKTALHRGDTPQALQYFDRVLCADPRNVEVLALLDQIARRRRIGRAIALLALTGLVGGGTYLASAYWPLGNAANSPDTRLDTRTPVAADMHVPEPDTRSEASVRQIDARLSADLRSVRIIKPPRRRVEILPTPKKMKIWVNGKLLGSYGPDLRYVKLPPGEVTLTFRNDACCFEKQVTIGPHKRPRTLRVRLPWKPGRVKVIVTPAVKADVLVGSLVGSSGQPIDVPIPSYSDNGRTRVEVKVNAPGFATESQTVTIRANATTTLNVRLTKR